MEFVIRDCIKYPLINIKPSDIDVLYLKQMRKFIKDNVEIYSKKYIFKDCNVGYVGITGNTFSNVIDVKFNLYTLDIDIKNKPDFIIDLTKNNNKIIKDNFFDVIICNEVLEHTTNPINCLDEIHRMLKSKGKLLLSTPYNFRIHGPLPDNFRFTEWFYKDILPKKFNILSLNALEYSNRKLCPINYFICAEVEKKYVLKGLVFPSGSGVAAEIYDSLKNHKDVELIFMNSTKNSQTTNLFKTKYSNAPIISNDTIEKLIQYVNHIIDIENINFIIPTMDICHFFLSKYSEKN